MKFFKGLFFVVSVWSFFFFGLQIAFGDSVFDERFEGAGYEEADWTESVGAGCTIDEDADVADVSSPVNWGNQCMKIINDTQANYTYTSSGAAAVLYWRVEVMITAESLVNGEAAVIFETYNNALNAQAYGINFTQGGSGDYEFKIYSFHDGTGHFYTAFVEPALNTKYRIEVKWDATNDLWSWKIDGVVQPNDQDSTSPVTTEGALTSTHATDAGTIIIGTVYAPHAGYTCYYDLVECNTAEWVGAEPTGNGAALLMGM